MLQFFYFFSWWGFLVRVRIIVRVSLPGILRMLLVMLP